MRRAQKLGMTPELFEKPLVILSAPRSGSTLLYELLARARTLWSIGGESHAIIEDLAGLDPTDGRVSSNRLTAEHADDETAMLIRAGFIASAIDSTGARLLARPASALPKVIRFLEKTPKNTLRVPFLRTLWPDARFVLLVRDPHAAIGSMLEAWESNRFVTYERLPGIEGPWSMMLPDGYAEAGITTAERAAFQWREANRVALADLRALPQREWCVVDYEQLTRDAAQVVRRIAVHAELDLEDVLKYATADTLPISTHTLSAPAKDKWRRHADRVEPVAAPLLPLYRELKLMADEVR